MTPKALSMVEKSRVEHPYKTLIADLDALAKLEKGWDGRDAIPPNGLVLHYASFILKRLRESNIMPMRIVPSVNGGLALIIGDMKQRRYAEFECFNWGETICSAIDQEKHQVFEVSIDGQKTGITLEETINRLNDFLGISSGAQEA